ncbi:hypothetical protein X801_06400, partial [Opisthorchis viverrini]
MEYRPLTEAITLVEDDLAPDQAGQPSGPGLTAGPTPGMNTFGIVGEAHIAAALSAEASTSPPGYHSRLRCPARDSCHALS